VTPGLREVERYIGDPAQADLAGTLVPALLDIYRRHTGQADAKPISIRGGTYARLFPGAVDFGPALPGRPYRGHAPDEYIDYDALVLTTKMLFDAVLVL
jgi:dipeptidase D